ncbi:energy transducer TonB [Algoriphagus hitonicola]|uniref:Protein TonB n=1 Tax=Algoriphagus hitonicola TaxID=435880 RepID=A0A1I2P124_9BACT|nr:energy transducer TonB [Algoriphagus hitonicola]SFG09393.1 protein TonB [Algoriphagus hitonicola]
MEAKKNQKADLKNKSSLFLNLGLTFSVGLVLVAFEWKSPYSGPLKEIGTSSENWVIEDIPLTIQTPPPPPPPVTTVEIKEVDNEIELDDLDLDIDINPSDSEEIPEVILNENPPITETADEVMDFTDVTATFKGGMKAWYNYLNKNLRYPSLAKRMGIEGTVLVRFVINKDGSVQDVEVLRPLGGGCDEVAMEVISNSPDWIPGKLKGQIVRSRMVMPIKFKLN